VGRSLSAYEDRASIDTFIEVVQENTVRVNVSVRKAPIYYELCLNTIGYTWLPGARLNPGFYSLDRRCKGFRFRSYTPGKPGSVVAECITEAEVGGPR
jgi:hypothetical protein